MAIDLASGEPLLNARQAAKYFVSARGGKPAHVSRVIRAITDGALGPDKCRHYLEALRQGSQWVTTAEAIQRYCEAITPDRPGRSPLARTPASRTRSAERAGRELDSIGI